MTGTTLEREQLWEPKKLAFRTYPLNFPFKYIAARQKKAFGSAKAFLLQILS